MMQKNFTIIAGPCVVENEEVCFRVADQLATLAKKDNVDVYFKSSYKKANRTRLDSFMGIGRDEALRILQKVKDNFGLPLLTDVHESHECQTVAEVVDVIQIPAFLCRQTELLVAAAKTGKIINIKKGQFLSPSAMIHPYEKVVQSGNSRVWLTERGTTFGYGNLIVDMTGIPLMRKICDTVIMDATHAVQQPNQSSGVTGGNPEAIGVLANAAIVAGCNGLFIETHPDPSTALSDGASMLALEKFDELIEKCLNLYSWNYDHSPA